MPWPRGGGWGFVYSIMVVRVSRIGFNMRFNMSFLKTGKNGSPLDLITHHQKKWWHNLGIPCENVQLIELTPALAKQFMERNTGNRNLREKVVSRYRSDIVHDRWQLNGEPLIFDEDGIMRSGQHRCSAVISADKSILVYAVFDVDRKAFLTMDCGVKRQGADQLGILGQKDSHTVSSSLSLLVRYNRSFYGNNVVSNTEIIEAWETHKAIHNFVPLANSMKKICPRSVTCMSAYMTSLINEDDSNAFWQAVSSGENLQKGDPELALSKRLTDMAADRATHHQEIYLYAVIAAWNARREKRTLTKIQIPMSISDFPRFK